MLPVRIPSSRSRCMCYSSELIGSLIGTITLCELSPSTPKSFASTCCATKSLLCRNSKTFSATTANLTVFRKLKPLDYLTSYTHRGRYYALRESARFDDDGLWSHDAVWFSRRNRPATS